MLRIIYSLGTGDFNLSNVGEIVSQESKLFINLFKGIWIALNLEGRGEDREYSFQVGKPA
jgi:hypothetical protein